jgi:hypothetical protein
MLASNLVRISSQVLQLLLGGLGVFCLYYAALLPEVTGTLLLQATLYGGLASTIVFFQGKYLSNV